MKRNKSKLGIIVLTVIILLLIGLKIYNDKIKGKNLLKKDINDVLVEYGIENYKIDYIKMDEDNKSICKYKINIYYDHFDDFNDEKKYEIINKLKYYQTDESPYCFVDFVTLYSNDDVYIERLYTLYKNDIKLYAPSDYTEKPSTNYSKDEDPNWQNYKKVIKNYSNCWPAKPDYVCEKKKNPVDGRIQEFCFCRKTYD